MIQQRQRSFAFRWLIFSACLILQVYKYHNATNGLRLGCGYAHTHTHTHARTHTQARTHTHTHALTIYADKNNFKNQVDIGCYIPG